MRLSSFSGQVNQNLTEGTVESTSSMEQGLKNGMEAVAGKLPGQSVSGEVLLRNGSDILISMGKNQLLQAKLEGNMSAQPGQMLTFQIKHNSSSKIVLTPLFENTSQDPNVSKALMAAGLPENSITAGMVRAMMQEGLSINRQSLFQMNRLINANPQTDIQTLVQMQRLSLPVTPENIAQFEAYKNYQHQLGESLSDIAEAFTQTFQEITGSGNMEEGLGFYKEVLGILAGEAEEGTVQDAVKAPVQGQENGQVQQMQGDVPKLGAVLGEAAEGELVKDTSAKEAPAKSGMPQALPDAMPELSKEETAELARQLKQAGFPIPEKALYQGFANAFWPGRFQVLGKDPCFIADGAHNWQGAVRLRETLQFYFTNRRIIYIIGVLRDKDQDKILQELCPLASQVLTIPTKGERGLSSYELAVKAKEYHDNVSALDSVQEAVELAYLLADKDTVITAFGSLSYLGELIKVVEKCTAPEGRKDIGRDSHGKQREN